MSPKIRFGPATLNYKRSILFKEESKSLFVTKLPSLNAWERSIYAEKDVSALTAPYNDGFTAAWLAF
jgi:hypothetical protein